MRWWQFRNIGGLVFYTWWSSWNSLNQVFIMRVQLRHGCGFLGSGFYTILHNVISFLHRHKWELTFFFTEKLGKLHVWKAFLMDCLLCLLLVQGRSILTFTLLFLLSRMHMKIVVPWLTLKFSSELAQIHSG